jgi:alpha-L-fucosidase
MKTTLADRLAKFSLTLLAITAGTGKLHAQDERTNAIVVSEDAEPMRTGKFAPSWDSLKQYEVPEWFRDAKFGIWAHWGPQCEPEAGDWYARGMYEEGSRQSRLHREKYGHPSKFGFKDVINEWQAENWDPAKIVALYKRAGAQYFFALANHHDNMDLYESKYQPWNSVRLGPKKDIIAGWAKATRNNGLKFGVSVHAAHAWMWYETAQRSDRSGEFAGVPYDGKLTLTDGKGLWWEGLDPQDLYAQNHPPGTNRGTGGAWHWDPASGVSIPDLAYTQKFYNRTIELINKYQPDLVYFDDTVLPLYPFSDAGLKIAAHYYNSSMSWNGGKLQAVLFGKILNEDQRKCLVWDIERGASNRIEPQPYQTCTCIGSWHYDRGIFNNRRYKSAQTVIHMLCDIVSKNGNLLLSVPLRGDGTLDDEELKVVEGITAWMDVNRDAILGTRPWKVFGEGPASENAPALQAQGFNEGRGRPFTAQDVRFTTKEGTLYAICMGWPTEPLRIKSLGTTAKLLDRPIGRIALLGSDEAVRWTQEDGALVIQPLERKPCDSAYVFKINSSN